MATKTTQVKKQEKVIAAIAAKEFNIPTLEARNSDHLDFHEVGVWSVKRALNEAYEAGLAAANAQK